MMRRSSPIVLFAMALLACAPVSPRSDTSVATGSAPAVQPKSIVFGVRYELISGQSKALNNTNSDAQKRLFNASLALMDSSGEIRPYLAETLPQLNTDSWRVNPDGTMVTTYRLRPNLTWHDGHALSADDF